MDSSQPDGVQAPQVSSETAPTSATAPSAVVEGHVVYKRKFKRIVFADILSDLSNPEDATRTEVVLREDTVGAEMLRRWARGGPTKVALGDHVRLTGHLEAAKEEGQPPGLQVLTVEVLKRWEDDHDRPMDPLPPPRNAAAAGPAPTGPCKFWINSGKCPRNPCPYAHDEAQTIRVVRKAWVGDRLEVAKHTRTTCIPCTAAEADT